MRNAFHFLLWIEGRGGMGDQRKRRLDRMQGVKESDKLEKLCSLACRERCWFVLRTG